MIPAAKAEPVNHSGFVRIDGIEQWVVVTGDDRANSTILVVHACMADLVKRNGRKLHGISRGRRSSQSLNGINAVRGVPMVATRFNVATHAGSRDVHGLAIHQSVCLSRFQYSAG